VRTRLVLGTASVLACAIMSCNLALDESLIGRENPTADAAGDIEAATSSEAATDTEAATDSEAAPDVVDGSKPDADAAADSTRDGRVDGSSETGADVRAEDASHEPG
jgi:hypothetical protein